MNDAIPQTLLKREIEIGVLHLIYHIQQPHLYIPSRRNRECRYCKIFANSRPVKFDERT